MKILSLISSFTQGGAQNVLVDLVTGLCEHEHRVVHFTGRKGIAAYTPYVERLGRASTQCIDAPWGSLNSREGRSLVLKGFQPDVVLCHWWGHDPWLPWVQEVEAVPAALRPIFVCVLHHHGIPVAAGYDRYVLVTRAQRPQCASMPHSAIKLIANGVDTLRFRGSARVRQPRRELVIGRLSNLRPGKIPEDWIRTVTTWQIPATRFVIAGSGGLLPHFHSDLQKVGQPGRISLPGHVSREKVPGFLATLDVFCHVTSNAIECCPLALLEALASGLPIVSEARGGIPDIVQHEQNGLLAESKSDVGSLLRRLQEEPRLVERLSRGALESVMNFSIERQLQAYRELLDELGFAFRKLACA